jgi:hypothetical protein
MNSLAIVVYRFFVRIRFACRFIPVDHVCQSEMGAIVRNLKPMIDRVFAQGEFATTTSLTTMTTNATNSSTTEAAAAASSSTVAPTRSFAVVWSRHLSTHMPDSPAAAAQIVPLVNVICFVYVYGCMDGLLIVLCFVIDIVVLGATSCESEETGHSDYRQQHPERRMPLGDSRLHESVQAVHADEQRTAAAAAASDEAHDRRRQQLVVVVVVIVDQKRRSNGRHWR